MKDKGLYWLGEVRSDQVHAAYDLGRGLVRTAILNSLKGSLLPTRTGTAVLPTGFGSNCLMPHFYEILKHDSLLATRTPRKEIKNLRESHAMQPLQCQGALHQVQEVLMGLGCRANCQCCSPTRWVSFRDVNQSGYF